MSEHSEHVKTVAIIAKNPNASLTMGFLPAAEVLGLNVVVLTDHVDDFGDQSFEVIGCNVDDHRDIITKLIERHSPVDYIFSNSDHVQTQTALAAEFSGLPHKNWHSTLRTKNKAMMRRHLSDVGMDSVRVVEIEPGQSPRLPDGIDFPVILKPREGVASEDVVRIDNAETLKAEYGRIRSRRPSDVLLVEEFLEGPLYTLETLGDGTELHTLGSFATTLAPGKGFVEERLDFPSRLSEGVLQQVRDQLVALGVGFGACHTEFIVDKSGRPRLIEVNYRLIGDDDDFLLAESTGLPLHEMILKLHMREPLQSVLASAPTPQEHCGRVEAVLSTFAGTILAAPGAAELNDRGVHVTYRPLRKAGDVVDVTHSNRDFLGLIRAVGQDAEIVDVVVKDFRRSVERSIRMSAETVYVPAEKRLVARVIDALLRENVANLNRYATDTVLLIPGIAPIALREQGFQQSHVVDLNQQRQLPSLDQLFNALNRMIEPELQDGLNAFRRECNDALRNSEVHDAIHPLMLKFLGGQSQSQRTGINGSTWFDSLGAFVPHPVYPTAQARVGFGLEDVLNYSPETNPTFELAWLAIPSELITHHGNLPSWWPRASDVGLGPEFEQHHLLPVHPSVCQSDEAFTQLLKSADLDRAVLAPKHYLQVTPTLSGRTVAVIGQDEHLKLPLSASTLGAKNRRSLKPQSLVNGAAIQKMLDVIIERESSPVIIADESTYASTGHEMFGYMVRRHPKSLDGKYVATVASLLAPAPDGRLVIELLADECFDGDVNAFMNKYLETLFDFHVMLFAKYGTALEDHQQNCSVVMTPGQPNMQLLIKDHDSPLINSDVITEKLGTDIVAEIADRRCLSSDTKQLTQVFTTITLHLDATAIARGLSDHHLMSERDAMKLVREKLLTSLDKAGEGGESLRAALFGGSHLPRKDMITVGTILPRGMITQPDINKVYGQGPNYLTASLALT